MASMDIDSDATPSLAITPVVLAQDNDETPISVEQPNKRRRKKSIVWEHFTTETVGPGCMRACCKQCKKSFAYITGSKLAGTSHLKRHIALGICPVSRQKNEASQSISGVKSEPPPKRRYRTSPALGSVSFNQDRCNQDVAKMIIQHDYPLHIVEHPAFIDFVRTLQPQYNMASFNTIQGEIVALYLREKQGLLSLINGLPGRVSISLDFRTSNHNVGYAFLTGHFIDNDWKLHRRILNVVMLPFPESEYAFNQAVVSCISDWDLESRLFTLTLDQSVSNDNIVGNLRGLLSVKNQLMFNGQLVKGNCYARVLSLLAQDALGATDEVVRRTRESVKYVKTSDSHDEKFTELRQRLQVPSTRDLIIDDLTKWDTTYHMLVAACELKEVFACLDTTDPFYKINPSMDDWKQVEILCTYLKLLYDAASILTGPMYPPANAFYHEVSKIQLELTHAAMSQDPFVSNLATPLKEKFDQYWRDCFLILAIAIVMDPRFKMKLVEFSFSRIFGEDAGMWIKIVDDGIHELFLDYVAPNLSVPTTYMDAENTNISHSDIFQEAHHREVASQEAKFQELQVMHLADLAQELDFQGATIQELQPEEVTTEVLPKELLRDPASQVMNHHEVAQQETPNVEAPVQETQTRELLQNSQELSNKQIDTQYVAAQEVSSQVEATQGMDCQEATQEMNDQKEPQEMNGQTEPRKTEEQILPKDSSCGHPPFTTMEEKPIEIPEKNLPNNSGTEPQEMDGQEVSVKEMGGQEATELQLVNHDVRMEEMQNTAEVPVQDKHIEEGSIKAYNKENVSKEELLTDERIPAEVINAQETTEEMQAQEKETQEMQDQDIPTQDIHTVEMHAQEEPNAEEKIEELKPAEEQINEIQPAEAQDGVMQPSERQDEVMQPSEGQTRDIETEGQTQEIQEEAQTREIPPVELQSLEMQPEGQSLEMCSPEGESEEMHPSVVKAHRIHPPAAESQVNGVHSEGAETHRLHSREAQPREMQLEEAQAHQMHLQEAHTNETQLQEAENHEMQSQSQDMHFQGVQYQEIHSQGMHVQEMEYQEMQSHEMSGQDLPLLSIGDGLQDFELYISEIVNSQHLKSELDQYLEESLLPRVQDFDVLGWWKLNKLKYPTLSKMAADILSIPVSTVAPESVFDIRSRKIDSYQSSLQPVTLEALVCAKDWLQSGSSASSLDMSNALVKMEH